MSASRRDWTDNGAAWRAVRQATQELMACVEEVPDHVLEEEIRLAERLRRDHAILRSLRVGDGFAFTFNGHDCENVGFVTRVVEIRGILDHLRYVHIENLASHEDGFNYEEMLCRYYIEPGSVRRLFPKVRAWTAGADAQ